MGSEADLTIRPIGRVESSLVDPELAPKQGEEGAPDAWLVLDPAMAPAVRDLTPGAEIIVLTWLDRADRGQLQVHPGTTPTLRCAACSAHGRLIDPTRSGCTR